MENVLQILIENGYEILLGVGIVATTICGKHKTAEQLRKIREKSIRKKERLLEKRVKQGKKLAQEIDKLKKEE